MKFVKLITLPGLAFLFVAVGFSSPAQAQGQFPS